MIFSVDYMRSKLLDYYAEKCTNGMISEEKMEDKMDDVELMSNEEIQRKFNKLIRKQK